MARNLNQGDLVAGGLKTALGDPSIGQGLFSPQPATTGQGGAVNTSRVTIWNRDKSFVMAGDRESLQEDINFAAYNGMTFVGDPTSSYRPTQTLLIPANISADFRHMIIKPADGALSGLPTARVTGAIGTRDYGNIDNLRMEQTLVNNQRNESLSADALYIGNGAEYVRLTNFNNLTISGYRKALRMEGSNNFILRFNGFRLMKAWDCLFEIDCVDNSGESIVFSNGLFADCKNTAGTAVAMRVTPGSATPDVYTVATSIDYCDKSAIITQGRWEYNQCHFEKNNNNSHIDLITTAQKDPPQLVIIGGGIAGGPLGSTGGERASGMDAIITTTGDNCSITMVGTRAGSFFFTGRDSAVPYSKNKSRNTQLIKSLDGKEPGLRDIRPIQDAGFIPVSGAAPWGAGQAIALSDVMNELYVDSANALSQWTYGGGWANETGVTNKLPGEGASFALTSTDGAGKSCSYSLDLAGQNYLFRTFQAYIHVRRWVAGTASIRIEYMLADGSTRRLDQFIEGLNNVSPLTDATATISGVTFNPGSTVQGTWKIGQRLAGQGVLAGTCISKDNGNGTYEVNISQTVAATTIAGFDRIVARRPNPNGAKSVKMTLYGGSANLDAYFSLVRAWPI